MMIAFLSCFAATLASIAATTETEQLDRILRGDVLKDELEIVLAQHGEDLSWSSKYANLRTVYCKSGETCAPDAIRLENVGREGHTYLSHIVNNYDRLAKWTVFSQAGEPTNGYKGQNQGGGHMLSGASFVDYLVHPQRAGSEDPEAFFLMTSKVHLPTLHHALRLSYKATEGQLASESPTLPAMCPASKMLDNSSDAWGPYEDMPWLRSFVSDKCGVEETAVGEAMLVFWDSFVQLPRPQNDVVHYAQGARFAVSRDRIRQRSKAFYERLLSLVSTDVDPCLNYLYEWAWYYILGKPEASPCSVAEDEKAQAQVAEVRLLTGGVSGVSGVSGSPTPAPTQAPTSTTTSSPTEAPTAAPTPVPTKAPTPSPTKAPTPASTPAPTQSPTSAPTDSYVVEGTVTMEVADPVVACNDDVLLSTFRQTTATLVGRPLADVGATCSVVSRGGNSNQRRLAGSVLFSYSVAMPSQEASDAVVVAVAAVPVETLTQLINDALPADHGYTVTATGKSEPTVVVVTLTSTTTRPGLDEELDDSHARKPASLGSLAVALIAAVIFH